MVRIFKQWKFLVLLMSLFFFSSCSTLGQKNCERGATKHHAKKCSKCSKKNCSKCSKKKCSKCSKKNCSKCSKKKCSKCSKKNCSKCSKKKCSKCSKKNCKKCQKKRCTKKGCKLNRDVSPSRDDDFAQTGNVIFIHPDGMSLTHWDAIRLYHAGLKGKINYDKLPHSAIYRGTIRGQVTATSNAGATIHAYGIKTGKDSFGMDKNRHIRSVSKNPYSIMIEAKKKV